MPSSNNLQINREFSGGIKRRQRGQRQRLVAQRLFPDAATMPVERAFRRTKTIFSFRSDMNFVAACFYANKV